MAGNRAVRIRSFGSPDVLEVCHQAIPEVQPATARVRHVPSAWRESITRFRRSRSVDQVSREG